MNPVTHSASRRIYLDHNATTPPDPQVLAGLSDWAKDWGNPSSIHQAGRGPKARLRESRDAIARLINASPLEIVFTSGGSESNTLAVVGGLQALRRRGDSRRHILSSGIEHPSIRQALNHLAKDGYEVELVSVDRSGVISLDDLRAKLRPEATVLVSIMYANNETGVIQPIKDIVQLAKAAGALVHTDSVQALGRMQVDVRDLGVDYASFAGHKFYSLRGVGVLFAKRGAPLEPIIFGGGQERHRRGGTENTLAIASLGAMAKRAEEIPLRAEAMRQLRNDFETRVVSEIDSVTVTGAQSDRLPSTSSLLIPGIDGETLLMSLDMEGYAVSTGAACSSGSPEPSPVLLAMGLSREEAQCSLRVGLGWSTTREEMDSFVETLKSVVNRLRHLRSWNSSGNSIQHPNENGIKIEPA